MKFYSDFALLDIKHGRKGVAKTIKGGKKIPVVIEGEIEGIWGQDDGISQEFEIAVKCVKVKGKTL
jgi:hypothetical protein